MLRQLLQIHNVAIGQDVDLIESGDWRDARARAGINEDLVARKPVAIYLDLVRSSEAAVAAIEGDVGTAVDLVLNTAAKRLDDLILARHERSHVDFDFAWMNAELRRDPGIMSNAGACDHRLGRRAPIVDARAPDLALLDQGDRPASIREIGGEWDAALARA